MLARLQPLAAALRDSFRQSAAVLARGRGVLLAAVIVGAVGYALVKNPPVRTVGRGEAGVRENRLTGEVTQWRDGSVLVIPFVHEMHVYSMRDRIYRPTQMSKADGAAPLQSLEGLSLGLDLNVRYALDPASLRAVASRLPDDIDNEVVEPAVSGIIYKIIARYTVKEIFSTKRTEISQEINKELRARLATDGIALHDVLIG
ncbi:MAG TPA: SPFH domain-containing protein, partial [Usitatibacter sp.]|nr:SPFH domain-containing protein [Usitatibacter sp.]